MSAGGRSSLEAERPWAAGFWIALLLAGQFASLRMILAGPLVGYQHYQPLPRLWDGSLRWALLLTGLQTLLVVFGLVRRSEVARGVLAALRGRAGVVVLAVLAVSSAALSRRPADYAGELLFASFVELVQLGNLLLIAAELNPRVLEWAGRLFHRLFGQAGRDEPSPGGPDRFAVILALWVTLASAALAVLAYQRHPHVPDEVVYLIHARYFAAGQLALPLPPVPEAFNLDLLSYQTTRWFSPVPPGWPAILAIGAAIGAPWLVNPLLGGINLLLCYALLRELYSLRTSRIALVLLAASPWNLFMAMNFMTHTATLTCALAAAVAVGRLRRDPRIRWAALGGVCVGVVGLIRPLEGAAVALVLGLWSLGARGRRFRLGPSAALTVATVATSLLVLPYNRFLTGSARVFPIMAYTDAMYGPGTNDLGFGRNRGLGWPGLDPLPGHGPVDVVINFALNLFQVNTELLGWATGSLLLLALWIGSGRMRRPDRLMLVAIGTIVGIHSFYYFSGGPDFGARYWFLIIVPCVALSARGLELIEAAAARAGSRGGPRVLLAAAVLVAGTVLVFVPWRAADKYHHYRGMRPDIRQFISRGRLGDGIALIRGRRHPDYASAAVYNPLDPAEAAPVFVWDRGPDVRRKLAAAYGDRRQFWIVDGPTITGRGYQVIAGPLSAAALLSRPDTLSPE